jgi:hypothetical protein
MLRMLRSHRLREHNAGVRQSREDEFQDIAERNNL